MIIGLCGLAGSGKSVVAKALVRQYGYVRRPFAYPLKAMVAALGVSPELLDGPSAVKELPMEQFGGKSLRFVLQTLGTEWGRDIIGRDFWVEQWMITRPAYPRIVADDVRFPNESAAVRSLGGIIVRVEREGAGSLTGAGHVSENVGLIDADCVIINEGTEQDLEASVSRLVGAHRGGDHGPQVRFA